jgi:hypothetical protein
MIQGLVVYGAILLVVGIVMYLDEGIQPASMTENETSESDIQRTTECESCGKQRYTFEACQHCGHVHWRDDD